jgi:hypothetical protein
MSSRLVLLADQFKLMAAKTIIPKAYHLYDELGVPVDTAALKEAEASSLEEMV